MGKYLVELKKNETLYKAATRESDGTAYVCSAIGTLYTEPDLEQIRKEAYKDGYDAGFGRKIDASYQEGLSDAWEAARKIIHMPEADLLNLFPECYAAVCTSVQVFLKYDASECIEKIRQYEQRQKEIKVGDEVNAPFGKAIVVNIDFFAKKIWLVYADGHGGFEYFKDAPTKTGRHFPEIAEVLAKMGETNNG